MMSEFAKHVKLWYDVGVWNLERMKNAVKVGKLSASEYEEITGKQYVE